MVHTDSYEGNISSRFPHIFHNTGKAFFLGRLQSVTCFGLQYLIIKSFSLWKIEDKFQATVKCIFLFENSQFGKLTAGLMIDNYMYQH